MLLGPAQAGAVTALTDLGGRSVAVELGSQGHVAATQWQRRLANVSVVPLNSAADALAAVAAGSAETALVDAISARLFIGQSNALQIIDEAVTVEPFALVVRKEDSDWLRVINRALAAMDESAELAGIMQRWFSAE
jgi:ABC-type amino acid transport substrate-binding protein